MSAMPTQRRNLPQAYAAGTRGSNSGGSGAPAVATTPDTASTTAAAAAAAPSQSTKPPVVHTHVFRKSAAAPPTQRMSTSSIPPTAVAAAAPTASAQSQVQPGKNHSSTAAPATRPAAAATMPWTANAPPQTMRNSAATSTINGGKSGLGQPSRTRQPYSGSNAADVASYLRGQLTSTPTHSHRQQPQPQQQVPSSCSRSTSSPPLSSAYADPAVAAASGPHRTDSSLEFALGEDSELKVLASRVGGAQLPRKPAASVAPTTATDGAGAHAHAVLPHTPSVARRGYNSGGAANDGEAEQHVGGEGRGVGAAAPSVRVGHIAAVSTVRNTNGAISAPPAMSAPRHQEQQQQQQQPAGRATRSSSGVPPYRAVPHELPSPPALHVCPGGVPGTGVPAGPPGKATAATAGTATTATAAAAPGSGPTRWVPVAVPLVVLYPSHNGSRTSSGASGNTGSALPAAANVGGGAMTRSNVSSAAPEGSTSAKCFHDKSHSTDARSQRSATPPPPPSQSSCAAQQPIPKDFTPAQREAVLRDVQQELYLNYDAMPIPADMINHGDTDERRRRMEQRQKQIAYGKETEGYATYTHLVPRVCDREYNNPLHALTPRPEYDCSKRQFDRVLNAWRRQLHQWDDCVLEDPAEHFLPAGTATLLDLGLALEPAAHDAPAAAATAAAVGSHTPTGGEGQTISAPQPVPPPPPTGVLHSIANVAAAAAGGGGAANNANNAAEDDEEEGGNAHTRSPVFTGHTPTSGLYSGSLSVHINSGRASAITAAACTPSRPQRSEGAEGPQVDESFFLHMNSSNSRIASPYHPAYAGSMYAAHGNGTLNSGGPHSNGGNMTNTCYSGNGYAANAGGNNAHNAMNGRSSANSYYTQFMRNNSYGHHHHHGGTPGNNYSGAGGPPTGLTPAHRPPSRSNVPHHMTAIFGCEYELMTPSGPGSPAGLPPHSSIARSGGSPYRLGEPWMPSRRSPTYTPTTTAAAATGNTAAVQNAGLPPAAANSAVGNAGAMGMPGTTRGGGSPPQTTELALIPSTSQSSSGGFAQSPYGFRVHSPVQPQQQQQQVQVQVTPLTRSQSRPGVITSAAAMTVPSSVTSPSRSPIGLPPQVQHQQHQQQSLPNDRVAIATTMAAVVRSRRGSGLCSSTMTWTPPQQQMALRRSPHTPLLHRAATPPATVRAEGQE